VTNSVELLTEQVGVPVWTCVPVGAAAALNVVTIAADDDAAERPTTIIASAAIANIRFKIPPFFLR
jgi:hypothetical protein